MLRKLLNKKLLKNIKCKINKNLTRKKSLKSSLKKFKKFNILSTYNIRMENIKLGDLYLSGKESRNIFELLAKMRNINDYISKSNDRLHEIFKKQSKNKERIDNIREDLKDLSYKLSKSELKEVKTNLYNIEKKKKN